MKIYKISYILDPRKALKFKSENSVTLPDRIYEQLGHDFCSASVIRLESGFNVLSVIICADTEITHELLSEHSLKLSETADTGAINFDINPLTAEEALSQASSNSVARERLEFVLNGKSSPSSPSAEAPVSPSADCDCKVQAGKKEAGEENIFSKIEELIALDEFKAWAREMKNLYDSNTEKELITRSLMCMSYLLSVNRGNGSSTVFESLGKVIAKLLGKKNVSVREYHAAPDAPRDSREYNIKDIITDAGHATATGETLYVFAIWIDKFQNNKFAAEWIKLVSALREAHKNAIFIFAVPYIEKIALKAMHDRIEDIMPNRVITVKPLSNSDYQRFFTMYFKNCNTSVSEDVYPLFSQLLADEKSDGKFYGIATINKICDEISYSKMMNGISGKASPADVITAEDIKPLLHLPEAQATNTLTGMQKLDAMISLDEVKQKIREIIATVRMQRRMNDDAAPSMHMMFSGSPGTGKTVVARLLGEILRENNLLSIGGFYEVSRKDLVGEYVGHTAPKTTEICKLAYGSVLFIDEAYLLDGGGEKDFGKEAIGTLIAEMENKRNDMVVIFAGYEKELEGLFRLNPGLRDRIPHRIHFSNYNRDELLQIFHKNLPSKFSYSDDFDKAARDFFENLSPSVLESPNFSNGRFVRNLVERMLSKAALRIEMEENGNGELRITAGDLRAAVSDGEFSALNESGKSSRIGF